MTVFLASSFKEECLEEERLTLVLGSVSSFFNAFAAKFPEEEERMPGEILLSSWRNIRQVYLD